MIVAFSVAPSGQPADAEHLPGDADTASVHRAVAAAVAVVRASGLPHRTSSMFTEIEGEWDEVMEVVRAAVDAVSPYGSRVSLVLKADIRPGHTGELDGKLERLESALAEDEGRRAAPAPSSGDPRRPLLHLPPPLRPAATPAPASRLDLDPIWTKPQVDFPETPKYSKSFYFHSMCPCS